MGWSTYLESKEHLDNKIFHLEEKLRVRNAYIEILEKENRSLLDHIKELMER